MKKKIEKEAISSEIEIKKNKTDLSQKRKYLKRKVIE